MKRKLGVLVLVALVALLAATPALAAGPGEGKGFQHKEGGPLGGWQAMTEAELGGKGARKGSCRVCRMSRLSQYDALLYPCGISRAGVSPFA